MIPFNVTIPPEQRDKELPQKLLAENSGILNWLLQGYASWKKEGLLEEPPVMKNANEMYRMDMDTVGPLWQSVLIMTRPINGELQQGSFTILM